MLEDDATSTRATFPPVALTGLDIDPIEEAVLRGERADRQVE